jgi:hypothetical protein
MKKSDARFTQGLAFGFVLGLLFQLLFICLLATLDVAIMKSWLRSNPHNWLTLSIAVGVAVVYLVQSYGLTIRVLRVLWWLANLYMALHWIYKMIGPGFLVVTGIVLVVVVPCGAYAAIWGQIYEKALLAADFPNIESKGDCLQEANYQLNLARAHRQKCNFVRAAMYD